MHDPDYQKRMEMLAGRWTLAQSTVAAFIGSVLPRHHDAEEILQRTAVSAVRMIDRYDVGMPFANWAIGLAKIEILRFRKERKRDHALLEADVIDTLGAAFARAEPELTEWQKVLAQCVGGLRGRVREILQLHHAESLRPAEIAERLGRTVNSVSLALHRGRQAVRKCVERKVRLEGGLP